MSLQGILVLDALGFALLLLILSLLAKGRLYAGYAALWMAAVVIPMTLVSVPPLLDLVTRAVGAIVPVSALTLLGFLFVILVFVLFSVKLTLLTERHTELVQALALRELRESERAGQEEVSQVLAPAGADDEHE